MTIPKKKGREIIQEAGLFAWSYLFFFSTSNLLCRNPLHGFKAHTRCTVHCVYVNLKMSDKRCTWLTMCAREAPLQLTNEIKEHWSFNKPLTYKSICRNTGDLKKKLKKSCVAVPSAPPLHFKWNSIWTSEERWVILTSPSFSCLFPPSNPMGPESASEA